VPSVTSEPARGEKKKLTVKQARRVAIGIMHRAERAWRKSARKKTCEP
jgi:hypothetical protein